MTKIKTVCVYCGSRNGAGDGFMRAADEFGAILARHRIGLVFGGGSRGLMGIVARATLKAGGEVTGVITKMLDRVEVGLKEATKLHRVQTMHQRKQKMFMLSDAFVVLPGGVGTMDETFEIIAWRQLGLHDKPIVVVDLDGYWQPLIGVIDSIVDGGFAAPETKSLFKVVTTIDEIPAALGI